MQNNARSDVNSPRLTSPEVQELLRSLAAGAGATIRLLDPSDEVLMEVRADARGPRALGGEARTARVPLQLDDETRWTVECAAPRRSGADMGALAGAVARMVSERLASEQRVDDLCAEILQSYRQLSFFYAMTGSLGDTFDMSSISRMILERTVELLGAGGGAIVSLAPGGRQLEVVASDGVLGDLELATCEVAESGLVGVVSGGESLVREGADVDATLVGQGPARGGAFAAVPVANGSQILGTVCVADRRGGKSFTAGDVKLLRSVAQFTALTMRYSALFDDDKSLFLGAVQSLVSAIEAKDPYTRGHSDRVTALSVAIARQMGFEGRDLDTVRLAGMLHDIGKIGIPEEILFKKGRLTDAEFGVIQQHPVTGTRILEKIEKMDRVVTIVRNHHERYDGRGYPDGLAGTDIPLPSRILTVADSVDAMMSNRVYRRSLGEETVLAELERNAGTQFDAELVELFIDQVRHSKDYHSFVDSVQSANATDEEDEETSATADGR